MRTTAVSLISLALIWTFTAAQSEATELDVMQPDSPHSRRNAILNRVSLPAGRLPDHDRRMRSKGAEPGRGRIEETYDKVLLSPSH
jgi:hypothetical protein